MLLLALTQENAGYPYELEQQYERRFGRLLPAAKGSAFRVLPILAEHGYVDGTPLPPRLHGVRAPQVRNSHGASSVARWCGLSR